MPPENDTVEQSVEADTETSISEDISAAITQLQKGERELDDDSTDDAIEEDLENEEEPKTDDDSEDGETDEDGENEDEDDDNEDSEELEAPHSWNKKAKKMFSELPEEAQEYIVKREKEQTKKITQTTQELSDLKKSYDEIEKILKPRRNEFALSGMSDAGAVRQLFAIADALQANPAEALQVLAGQFGVDLKTVGQVDEDDETTDPALKEIKKINKRLDEKDNNAKTVKNAQLEKYINDFKNKKDDDGDLLHPRFDELKPVIGRLVSSGMAKSLDEAYKQAETLHPGKEAKQKTKTSKNKEAEKAKNAKRAAKAKKAAAGVNSKSSKSGGGELSLKDELRDAIGKNTLRI